AVLLAADAFAPCAPRLIEQLDRHSEAGPDDAAVVDERLDRRGQHLKVLDGLARAGGLDEVAALAQPPVSVHGPVEDAGQLGEQPRGESRVLAAVERAREHQHDQPPDQGAGGVGDARQLVGEDGEARRQAAGPGADVLAVDGERVLARDREEALGDGGLIAAAAQAGVGDKGEWLADERRQPERGQQAGERWVGDAVAADERGEHARDGALARAARADDKQDLLLRGIGRERVAEPVLKRCDGALVGREQVPEKGKPVLGIGRAWVEGNLARGEAEVVRGRRIEITAWRCSSPFASGNISVAAGRSSASSSHAGGSMRLSRLQTEASASSTSETRARLGLNGTSLPLAPRRRARSRNLHASARIAS